MTNYYGGKNQPSKIFDIATFVVLALVVLATFYNLPDNFFLRDDAFEILGSVDLRKHISDIFTIRACKPVVFFIRFKLFGLNPQGYYLTNILIHILNSFLVYKLFASLLTVNDLRGSKPAALAAGLVFVTNFSHHEAVLFISGVDELIYVFFYVLSILFFLKFLGSHRLNYYILSLISFVLSIFGKQAAVTLPLIVFITCSLRKLSKEEGEKQGNKVFYVYSLPYFCITLICLFFYKNRISSYAGSDQLFNLNIFKGYSFLKIMFYYMSDLFRSLMGLTDVMGYFTHTHLLVFHKIILPVRAARILIISFAVLVVGMFVCRFMVEGKTINKFKMKNDFGVMGYGFLWMVITFLPFALMFPNLTPTQTPNPVSRYLYLPSVGFSFFVAAAALTIYDGIKQTNLNKMLLFVLVGSIVFLNALRTYEMETLYHDNSRDLLFLTRAARDVKRWGYKTLVIVNAPYLLQNLHDWALSEMVLLFYGGGLKIQWVKREEMMSNLRINSFGNAFFMEFDRWNVMNNTKYYHGLIEKYKKKKRKQGTM